MCNPQLAFLAITAVTTVANYQIESRNADRQEKALIEASRIRGEQIDDAATQEANEEARRARREQAQIRIAAGAAGLSLGSNSVAAQLLDAIKQSKENQSTIERNRKNAQDGRTAESTSLLAGVSRPSALLAGLQIAGSAANAYASGGFSTGSAGRTGATAAASTPAGGRGGGAVVKGLRRPQGNS